MPASAVPYWPVDWSSPTCGRRPIDHHIRSAARFGRPDVGTYDVTMVSPRGTAAVGGVFKMAELDANSLFMSAGPASRRLVLGKYNAFPASLWPLQQGQCPRLGRPRSAQLHDANPALWKVGRLQPRLSIAPRLFRDLLVHVDRRLKSFFTRSTCSGVIFMC